MAEEMLVYSFVARGTVILAEHRESTGSFIGIANQCLQKLPATNNKFTYNYDGHAFSYHVGDGYTYCIVAVDSIDGQVPRAFLERIKEDFSKKYGGEISDNAVANSLDKDFGPKLKEHMQYCMAHSEEISNVERVKAQVSEIKGVMVENINMALDRGEKIDVLVIKTESLHNEAQKFKKQGEQIKRKMWCKNAKMKLIVLSIIIALILIIILSVCNGFNC